MTSPQPTPEQPDQPGISATEQAVCRCGHPADHHTHLRHGSDCSLCDCPRWRPTLRARARALLRR